MTTQTQMQSPSTLAFAQVFGKAFRAGWEVNTSSGALPPDEVIEKWIEAGAAEDILKRSYLTPLSKVEETLSFYREDKLKGRKGTLSIEFCNEAWTALVRQVKHEPIAS